MHVVSPRFAIRQRWVSICVAWLVFNAWDGMPRVRAQTNLLRLNSPHFALITDGSPKTANQLSLELEVFRETISRFLGLPREQRTRVRVYLFATQERFDGFRPASVSKSKAVAGLAIPDGFTHALMVRLMPDLEQTRAVMFHEYTHLLTARPFQGVPLWMNEGLAEVFSTFEVGNRQFSFAGPLAEHVHVLATQGSMPASGLLEVRHDSDAYNHGNEVPRFYASAWNLAHALTVSGSGFNGAAVRNYIIHSGVLTNRSEAFRRAFGTSPEVAVARADTLFRRRSFPLVTEAFDGTAIPVRTLQTLLPAESSLELGTLARMGRLHSKGEQLLREAERAMPDDLRPHEQLGLLLDQLDRPTDARVAIERAIELGSVSGHVYYVAAKLCWGRLAGRVVSAEERIQRWQEVRRLIERAIQLDPDQAACHSLLASALLVSVPDRPKEAETAARRALQLDPYLYRARLTLAEALATGGQKGEARRAIAALQTSPIPPSLMTEVEALAVKLGIGAMEPASKSR